LVPEQTHQVEKTESWATTSQTSQTGTRRAAKESRVTGKRGWGERFHRRVWCRHRHRRFTSRL